MLLLAALQMAPWSRCTPHNYQTLEVGRELGAYEFFLRCLQVALFSVGDSWNLVVENVLEAVACNGSKGGHLGPCSINFH